MKETRRLYTDLAWLWPLWGDASVEYAHYCRHVVREIQQHARRPVRTLLNIGCGGGKNIFNLKGSFQVTGLDLSPTMLAQARHFNPECEFVQGDMRCFQLDRTFDAILMDDAVTHMNCRADFTATFRTAWAHLEPGGVLITTADVTAETFEQNATFSTAATDRNGPDHVDVVFIENDYDTDPCDEQYEATLIYLIRENGVLRVETDHFLQGLFSLDTWRSVLLEIGFTISEGTYEDGRDEYTVFTCVRPQ